MRGVFNIIGFIVVWTGLVLVSAGLALFLLAAVLALIFIGAQSRAQKAEQLIQRTLMADEQVVAQALQHRAFALWNRRVVVAITGSRILTVKRGLLGGFTMSDIQWKDLKDVTIESNVLENLCGSNLKFAHLNANVGQIDIPGIDSQIASTIYGRAQSEEQAWEEKRRIRQMEEVRARAGGVVVNTALAQPSTGAAAPAGNRMLSEIQEAKKLMDDGVISDAEFQEMKSKILASS